MMSNPKIDAKVGNLEKYGWYFSCQQPSWKQDRSISFWGFLPEKMAEKMVGK